MYYNTYKFEVSNDENDEDDGDDGDADPERRTRKKVNNIIITCIYII